MVSGLLAVSPYFQKRFVPVRQPAGAATYCASKAAVHSYTQSLRVRLAGQVQGVEIVLPAVQTKLAGVLFTHVPLDRFIDGVMAQFASGAPGQEVAIADTAHMRKAEAEGRFSEVLTFLSGL